MVPPIRQRADRSALGSKALPFVGIRQTGAGSAGERKRNRADNGALWVIHRAIIEESVQSKQKRLHVRAELASAGDSIVAVRCAFELTELNKS